MAIADGFTLSGTGTGTRIQPPVSQNPSEGAIERANQTLAEQGVSSTENTQTTRPKGAPVIQADNIGSEPFVPPAPQQSTSALSKLEAGLMSMQEQLAAKAEQEKTATAESSRADTFESRLLGLTEQLATKGDRTEQIMEEQQVLEAKQALDATDQDIASRERYYDLKIRDLQDKGGGLKPGATAEENTIRRERARELADLYIVRAGQAQQYETQYNYAKDLVDAEFEPIQDQIDNLTNIFTALQNDLSDSEQLEAQAIIDQKKSDRDTAKNTADAIYSELVNAGALTPERQRILKDAMMEATKAIENGQSPDAAIAKMQEAMIGVQSLERQKFDLEQQKFAEDQRQFNITESRLNRGTGSGALTSYTEDGEKVLQMEDGSVVPVSSINFDDPQQVDMLPVDDLTKAVMGGFIKTKDLTPTDKSKVAADLQKIGFNPNTYVVKKLEGLLQDYVALPESSRGLVEGLKFWQRWTDGDVAEFESNKAVLTREIARLNDVGVLSDQDVKTYNDAMPSRQDADVSVSIRKAAGIASSVTGKNPENIGKFIQLEDGRTAIVGLDGDTLLDPTTMQPLE